MTSNPKVFWVSGIPPGTSEYDITALIPAYIPKSNVVIKLHSTQLCSVACPTPELALMLFNVLNGKHVRGSALVCAWGGAQMQAQSTEQYGEPMQLQFSQPLVAAAAAVSSITYPDPRSQGPELEQTVMQRESGNPIFSFLFGGPFYDYYQWLKFTAITNKLMRPDPATPPQEFLQSMFVLASQIQALKFAQPPNSLLLRQAATQVQQEIFRQVSGISGANVLFSQIKPATIAGAGFPPYGIPPAPFPGVFPPGMVFPQMTFAHPMQQMQLHQQQLQQQQLQQQIQQQQIQMQQQIQQQQIQQQQQQRRPLVRVKLPRDGDSLSEKQSAYFLSLLKNLQGSKPSIKEAKNWMITHIEDSPSIVYYICKAINLEDDPLQKINYIYLISDMLHHGMKMRSMNGELDNFGEATLLNLKPLIYPAYRCQSEKLQSQLRNLIKVWGERSIFDNEVIERLLSELESEPDFEDITYLDDERYLSLPPNQDTIHAEPQQRQSQQPHQSHKPQQSHLPQPMMPGPYPVMAPMIPVLRPEVPKDPNLQLPIGIMVTHCRKHHPLRDYKPIRADTIDFTVQPLTPAIEKSLEAICSKFYAEMPR